jgi:hypothetical protein
VGEFTSEVEGTGYFGGEVEDTGALRTDSDLLFFEKPSVAVQTAVLNEVRKGTLVGGIRLARVKLSSGAASTASPQTPNA